MNKSGERRVIEGKSKRGCDGGKRGCNGDGGKGCRERTVWVVRRDTEGEHDDGIVRKKNGNGKDNGNGSRGKSVNGRTCGD
jgi:hypothetical protein